MLLVNVGVNRMCKKDYSCSPSRCICENKKYSKCIVDDSVIVCDEVINATDSVLRNMIYTVIKNVTSTASISSDDKRVDIKQIVK